MHPVPGRDTIKLRGVPNTHRYRRLAERPDQAPGLAAPGTVTTRWAATMGDPQPSPTGPKGPTDAVHRLNGSGPDPV